MLQPQHALSRSLMFALLLGQEVITDAREAQERARGVAMRAAAARARSHALRAMGLDEADEDAPVLPVAAMLLSSNLSPMGVVAAGPDYPSEAPGAAWHAAAVPVWEP